MFYDNPVFKEDVINETSFSNEEQSIAPENIVIREYVNEDDYLNEISSSSEEPMSHERTDHNKYFKELLVTKNQPISIPILSDEVRALADAKKFSKESILLLNNRHERTKEIIRALLAKMFYERPNMIQIALKKLLVRITDKSGNYLQFSKTINGFEHDAEGSMLADSSWLVAMASMSQLDERMVGITTLVHTNNMGANHSNVRVLAIVLTPVNEKHTKSDIQTGRNIAAVLSEPEFKKCFHVKDINEKLFRIAYKDAVKRLKKFETENANNNEHTNEHEGLLGPVCFGRGIFKDLKRRIPHYISDYTDTFSNKSSVSKTVIAIFVMFFATLLPTIAFGMLNESSTNGKINVVSGILAQLIGGEIFAIFGGQQLIVMLTTSPLCIMIMVINNISSVFNFDFFQFYAWIGIFNSLYLIVYSILGFSWIMKFSRRSTEETFALFVSVTFVVDSLKACIKSFNNYYHGEKCLNATHNIPRTCLKEESLLFLLLLLGTMAIGLWLNGLTRTSYLIYIFRKLLSKFALALSVLLMSLVGSLIFRDVKVHSFNVPSWRNISVNVMTVTNLSVTGYILSAVIALPISILFFMEQNIASSIINNPVNRLKKGSSYHWDLMVVSGLNLILSVLGLPWVHGALPHSPMHLEVLASIEEHIDEGNHATHKVVSVVETRIPTILANLLVGLCIFLMPYPIQYIPAPVLYGLFLYMAFTALEDNQFFERLLLFFTEQSAYPPNHYLKRVPQKKVHIFTVIQILQLIPLCIIGFFPILYVKMIFPLILILQLPLRQFLFPKLIKRKYLDVMDKSFD